MTIKDATSLNQNNFLERAIDFDPEMYNRLLIELATLMLEDEIPNLEKTIGLTGVQKECLSSYKV